MEYEDGVTKDIGIPSYGTVSLFNMNFDLHEILDTLDEVQRELLVLRFIQGCTSEEVAEVMGGVLGWDAVRQKAEVAMAYNLRPGDDWAGGERV